MATATEIINIGLIYSGKELSVEIRFSVDQDVNDAFVELTVPEGLTYSKDSLPKGSYNAITNVWNIGSVQASDPTLIGLVYFSVTDATKSEFDFTITGGVESACEGCLTGNTRCVTYQGIPCGDLDQCSEM